MRVSPHIGHSMPGINTPNINPQWGQNDEIVSISSITNLRPPNHSFLLLSSLILMPNPSLQ